MSVIRASGFFLFTLAVIFFVDITPVIALGPTNIFTTTPLTTPTTWTRANSPYVIRGSGWLPVTAPLTIEPGVVIKFWPNRGNGAVNGLEFSNGGNLIAHGTDIDPIIFTSVYDDTVAGDTNNDGVTPPLPGDWSSLRFTHDTSTLSHIIVRYGGNIFQSSGSLETKNNSQLTMTDATISESAGSGLSVLEPSSPHLTRLTIQNNHDYGISATVTSTAAIVTNSTIDSNKLGALYLASDHSLRIDNTVFTNNTPQTVEIKGNTITHDTTWQYYPGLTYVYWSPGKITIPKNTTLTIDPGVVIKLPTKSGLYVQGTLHANGTPTQLIIFTSYRDSTIGGDIAYSGPTVGMPGDWGGIYIDHTNSQTSTLSYLTLKYGGVFADHFGGFTYAFTDRNLINVNNSTVTLDHVTLDQGFDTAITLTGNSSLDLTSSTIQNTPRGLDLSPSLSISTSSLTITNNRFVSTSVFALRMNTNFTLDVRHNWWGDDTGPTTPTNPTGQGNFIFGSTQYDPWIGKPETRIPVILIPGILGTEMKKGIDTIWMDLGRLVGDVGDDFLDVLGMDGGGLPIDETVFVGDVVRSRNYIFGTFNYLNLLIESFAENGYVENQNLFVFPYDWRLDIHTNSQLLNQKITQVLNQTGSTRVNIVAHSMGGLVTKSYLLDHPDAPINTIVFVGTPHLGAPKAFKALVEGDTFGIPLVLSSIEMKKLAKNMPSAYQLLPSRQYVENFGSYFFRAFDGLGLSYNDTQKYLHDHGSNQSLLARGELFSSSTMDHFTMPPHIQVYNISGCDKSTVGNIIWRNQTYVLEGEGVVHQDEYDLRFVAGDGTVPFGSSDAVTTDFNHAVYFKNADHGKMPSQVGIREAIVSMISDQWSPSTLPFGATTNRSLCKLSGTKVSSHSPVALHVYDQAGNHIGPGPNNTIEEGVEGIGYEVINHNTFVFLPNAPAEDYSIRVEALATGTFSMRVSDVASDTITQTAYYNDIAIIPNSQGLMNVTGTSSDLLFDYAGDNHLTLKSPSAVLDITQSMDLTAPSTTADVGGVEGKNGWYRSAVDITLRATDDNAGVLEIRYSLDGGILWSTYAETIHIDEDGAHQLLYTSTDKAGNREPVQERMIKIDKTPPEANIVFDPNIFNFIVHGVDALSTTTIMSAGVNKNIIDEAGNSLIIPFVPIVRPNNVRASLQDLVYNDTHVRIPVYQLLVSWTLTRDGRIRTLSQGVIARDHNGDCSAGYNMFDSKSLMRERVGLGIEERLVDGLALIYMRTNNGSIFCKF